MYFGGPEWSQAMWRERVRRTRAIKSIAKEIARMVWARCMGLWEREGTDPCQCLLWHSTLDAFDVCAYVRPETCREIEWTSADEWNLLMREYEELIGVIYDRCVEEKSGRPHEERARHLAKDIADNVYWWCWSHTIEEMCTCLKKHLDENAAKLCEISQLPEACWEVEVMSYKEREALQQEYTKILKTYIAKECRS